MVKCPAGPSSSYLSHSLKLDNLWPIQVIPSREVSLPETASTTP